MKSNNRSSGIDSFCSSTSRRHNHNHYRSPDHSCLETPYVAFRHRMCLVIIETDDEAFVARTCFEPLLAFKTLERSRHKMRLASLAFPGLIRRLFIRHNQRRNRNETAKTEDREGTKAQFLLNTFSQVGTFEAPSRLRDSLVRWRSRQSFMPVERHRCCITLSLR